LSYGRVSPPSGSPDEDCTRIADPPYVAESEWCGLARGRRRVGGRSWRDPGRPM